MFLNWVRGLFYKPGVYEYPDDNHIKDCINKALENDKTYDCITYKGKPYDFSSEDRRDVVLRLEDYNTGGFYINMYDEQGNKRAYINLHIRYDRETKEPYGVHIHKLKTMETYRMKGHARYLISVALLIAELLDVEKITVINTCDYRELYSLFRYHSKEIIET